MYILRNTQVTLWYNKVSNNDAYYKTQVSCGASNHIPTHISSQGIPLKCYTVKCYSSIPEVTGSYIYCEEQTENE